MQIDSSLDHVFVSDDLSKFVSNYTVIDSPLNLSDHLPVSFCLLLCQSYSPTTGNKPDPGLVPAQPGCT